MNFALCAATSRPRRPYFSLASTTIERPSGVSSARLDNCAASASSLSRDTCGRQELHRLAAAERDRAGLVEQQRVHVARGLDRLAAHRQHVVLHHAVHAGDADRREQAADRRRNQAHQQRHVDGDRRRRARPRPTSRCRSRTARSVATASRKMIVRPAIRMFSAISFGVFCRSAPSTSAIIRSRNVSPGFDVILILMWSERTRVPPVTALRSPPDSRITGALSPVITDSSTVAMPSMTSPSPGMTSPASHDHDVAGAQLRRRTPARSARRADDAVRDRVGLGLAQRCPPALCRAPRPSPRQRWRTAR